MREYSVRGIVGPYTVLPSSCVWVGSLCRPRPRFPIVETGHRMPVPSTDSKTSSMRSRSYLNATCVLPVLYQPLTSHGCLNAFSRHQLGTTSFDNRRAEQLIGGLGDERERWQASAERLSTDINNLVGNVMLASGCLAYLGPFTSQFRKVSALIWRDRRGDVFGSLVCRYQQT